MRDKKPQPPTSSYYTDDERHTMRLFCTLVGLATEPRPGGQYERASKFREDHARIRVEAIQIINDWWRASSSYSSQGRPQAVCMADVEPLPPKPPA